MEDFLSIYDLVNETFGEEKLKNKEKELKAVELYNLIKIEALIKTSKAVNIVNGNLIINTKDSSCVQFIQLKSEKIIKAINKKMGSNTVKKLVLRHGNYKRENPSNVAKDEKENDFNIEDIDLEEEKVSYIENILDEINDNDTAFTKELKKRLRKLFINSMKFNKIRNKYK